MNNVRYAPFAGRLLIGLPFMLFGFGKATTFGATVTMIGAVGLPVPPLAAIGAIALEIVGGALLVAGYKARPVAALLAIFSIVTALYFHSNLADTNTFVHFFKNVMMTGGLLQITGFGAGSLSLDEYLSNRRSYSNRLATAK